jgi:hypothetical protein
MKRALQRLFSLTSFLTAEITASIFVSVIPRINGQRDEALKTGARLRKIRWLVAEYVSAKRMKVERNEMNRPSDVLARQSFNPPKEKKSMLLQARATMMTFSFYSQIT